MIKARVKETSTTTGTGTLNLDGPVAGFRSFVNGFGTGNACYYVIIDGTAWEAGIGTVTSGAPDTLTRETVLDSSAAGAKLSLGSGTKSVFNDAPLGLVFIQSQSASASASIDFVTGITSTYDEYLVTLTNIIPATDSSDLLFRISQDAGSTFKSGATDYAHARNTTSTGPSNTPLGSAGDTSITITNNLSNASARTFNGELRFFAPAGTAKSKQCLFQSVFTNNFGAFATVYGAGGFVLNTAAINGIRFLMSSGNITSGIFTLYGVRKS